MNNHDAESQNTHDDSPEDEKLAAAAKRCLEAINCGNSEQAGEASAEVMQLAMEHYEPSPGDELIFTARGALQCCDWQAAEKAYLQIIALARERSKFEITSDAELVSLYLAQGRTSEALQHAREMYEHCRSSDIEIFVAICVRTLSSALLSVNLAQEAELELRSVLARLPGEAMYDLTRAGLLVEIAETRRRQHDLRDARQLLDQAWPSLEPMQAMLFATGLQFTIGKYWEISARTYRSAGEVQLSAKA